LVDVVFVCFTFCDIFLATGLTAELAVEVDVWLTRPDAELVEVVAAVSLVLVVVFVLEDMHLRVSFLAEVGLFLLAFDKIKPTGGADVFSCFLKPGLNV
jgi:hypothetical protein